MLARILSTILVQLMTVLQDRKLFGVFDEFEDVYEITQKNNSTKIQL